MRVSVLKTDSYEKGLIKDTLLQHFSLLGGVTCFIKPHMRVFIKPNLLMPQNEAAAVTTHPYFVEALAQIVREAGAQAVIGDSGGGPYTHILQSNLYRATGMKEAAQNSCAQLAEKIMPPCTISFPSGKIATRSH